MREIVQIINYVDLPANIQDKIQDYAGFSNNCYLEYMHTLEDVEWSLGESALMDYHLHELDVGSFKGTYEEFIKEYDLELARWIGQQPDIDMTGIGLILISVCY